MIATSAPRLRRRLPALVLAVAASLASGCGGKGGSSSTSFVCDPACPKGFSCTATGCLSDSGGVDFATTGGGDLGPCSPACSGATPYCNQANLCVACLQDDQCPKGQVCKQAGAITVCVTGCTDDNRCDGGQRCCGGTCLDTGADVNNCGGCGTVCGAQNATATCTAGVCGAGACNSGWGDCNGSAVDGCETNLAIDAANCGACRTPCKIANATAGCAGVCYIQACNFGFDDCDAKPDNGCETSVLSDAKNCGACGASCPPIPHAKPTCINASCQLVSCDQGYLDCNQDPRDGCEVNTFTDSKNCGACGTACGQGLICKNGGCTCPQCNFPNATSKCVNFVCQIDQCIAGWADCNGKPDDGCEVQTAVDVKNCGACGNVCPMNLPGCDQGQCVLGYFPMGPITNVPIDMLAGWKECYRDQYANNATSMATILKMCDGNKLMLACSPKASNTITLAAWADRADVTFDTGQGNVTHRANGVEWYYNTSWSLGFALEGDAVSRNSCDTNNTHPDNRLCWHTQGGNINGGWRCGQSTGLNGDINTDRIIFQTN